MKSRYPPEKSRKEAYEAEYKASKEGGEPFYPHTVVKDAIIAVVVVGTIFVLALLFPATSEPPADPTSTTYNPRPEWYFLFFFQFLKFFPGWMEPIAAVIIPGIALTILILVPFFDRGLERRWSKRQRMLTAGGISLAFLVLLEVLGASSAPAQPAGEVDPLVQQGQSVYRDINCGYCHSINGVGGAVGPDLSSIGSQMSVPVLTTYLQNPNSMIPQTLHPKLQFTPEELQALVAYLETLGAQVSYTVEAPQLFKQNCSACHIINGQGGALGPDLSGIGSRRSLSFLQAFTSDPKSAISGTTMPPFKGALTPEQINDIAAYMYSLKSKPAGPAPSPSSKPSPSPSTK